MSRVAMELLRLSCPTYLPSRERSNGTRVWIPPAPDVDALTLVLGA